MGFCLIQNGMVVDGTGQPERAADVLIRDGIIETVGVVSSVPEGAEIIEAAGLYVTPGFIDIHRHCDYALFREGFGTIELAQGITTTFTGNCGLTPYPLNPAFREPLYNLLLPCLGEPSGEFSSFAEYQAAVNGISLPLHVGHLIGSCSVRIAVKGFSPSPFTQGELDKAKGIVGEALDAGAYGLSFGIMYFPEFYSTKDELTELAAVAARKNAVLTCHIRGEGDSLVASVREVLEIAERAGVSLEISHFKSCGVNNWNREIYRAIEWIDRKRATQDVHVDFYPYHGGATTLLSLIPPGYMKPTLDETWEYMVTDAGKRDLEAQLVKAYDNWDNYALSLGFDRIVIASVESSAYRDCIGKTVADIAAERPDRNPYAFICEILAEESGQVGILVMSMSPEDIDTVARLPYSIVISDALYPKSGVSHPRLFGAFTKILTDFVWKRKVLSLADAVHKMTGLPAQKLNVRDRGVLLPGYVGDITIFHPSELGHHAHFTKPSLPSTGIRRTLVQKI